MERNKWGDKREKVGGSYRKEVENREKMKMLGERHSQHTQCSQMMMVMKAV